MIVRRLPLWFVLLALACVACASSEEKKDSPTTDEPVAATADSPFSREAVTRRLTILHTSDNESDLLGGGRAEGDATRGGVSRMMALVRGLRERAKEPVLVVASGDTMMPAPELHMEIDGVNAVAQSNNLIGYDVSALGNHEWDLGGAFLADYLKHSRFPYLSASIEVTGGPLAERWVAGNGPGTSGWASDLGGKVTPRTRVCLGERKGDSCDGLVVGVIGATTEMLRGISNVPDQVKVASTLEELRARVQAQADAFAAAGVDVVVLLSHLQDARKEIKLVDDGLTGVDVVVAGGGDNRLANADQRLFGDHDPDPLCASHPEGCYPIVRRAKDGRPVIIVATDGQLSYLGHLSVGFDAQGVLTDFTPESRPWPVDEESLLELRAEPARDGLAFEQALLDKLAPLASPFAKTSLFLEGTREAVRNRQTNLGDLSADAMAWAARQGHSQSVGFALRNGGGIRAPIGTVDRDTYERKGGPLRPLDVKSALRFDGPIVVIDTTHRVLRDTVEGSLRGAGSGRGRFPQVSSEVLIEYTRSAPEQTVVTGEDGTVSAVACPGQRLRTLRVSPPTGAPVDVVRDGKLLTPKARISFATLGFLARGGDGWFPASTAGLKVTPVKRDGGDATEQRSFTSFVLALDKDSQWQDGAGYVDPVPGQADSFTRIREVDVKVTPEGKCKGE
jgi:alkaline phosphatase